MYDYAEIRIQSKLFCCPYSYFSLKHFFCRSLCSFLLLCWLLSDVATGDVVAGWLKTPINGGREKNEPPSGQADGNTGGWSADSRPVFLPTPRNITVGPGDRAVLKCRVDHLGTRTVSFKLHGIISYRKTNASFTVN